MGIARSFLRVGGVGALLCLVAAPLASTAAASEEARVSGTVSYRARIALPPGYVVRIELVDIARQDVAARTIAAVDLTPAHQVPVPYEIAFDADRLDPRARHAVRAQIRVDGRLWFASTRLHHLPAAGASRRVDILLQRVATAGQGARASAPAPALAGEWRAEDIGGRGVIDNPPSTLRLEPDGRVSGMGGCNPFTGRYWSSVGGLRLGPLAATQKMCPPAVMDQEAKFFAALAGARAARTEGPFLVLLAGDGTRLARLVRL